MHVSNYIATFSPMHLVFLELDINHHHRDFKILDEKTTKSFRGHSISNCYIKMSIYDNETKFYPDLNPTVPQEPQTQTKI